MIRLECIYNSPPANYWCQFPNGQCQLTRWTFAETNVLLNHWRVPDLTRLERACHNVMDTALDCDGNVFFCNKLDRIYTILPKVGVLYVFNIFHIDLNTFIFELKCTINTLAATTFREYCCRKASQSVC